MFHVHECCSDKMHRKEKIFVMETSASANIASGTITNGKEETKTQAIFWIRNICRLREE